jgi:cytochrome P450
MFFLLLAVAGNETTRNATSHGMKALIDNPAQFAALRDDPSKERVERAVEEILRWATPVLYFRRTATRDVEVNGKQMHEGDKIAMWYVSGNRDEEIIDRPNEYIIDRERVRQHLSFGFGIHRCVGNRLAELQLKIIWEEILKRFPKIEVTGQPRRVLSSFVKGYESLPVIIPTKL